MPNDAYAIIEDRARSYQMRTEETADWWGFTPAQKQVMEVGTLYNARLEETSHKLSAGGLVSTAGDLVRFAVAVFEGRLLSAPAVERMLTEHVLPNGEGTGWGLGWSGETRNGLTLAGLRGAQPGATAQLLGLPSEDFAVAVIANRDLVPTQDLVRDLFALWDYDLSND
jgi:CubicO group peptidase (beta-lactamase class C family)